MIRTCITAFFFMIGISINAQTPNCYVKKNDNYNYIGNCLHWRKAEILTLTKKKPARTAILIIAPPEFKDNDVQNRWKLGKKVWEQYMNSHPKVDCYFIQNSSNKKDSNTTTWIEGNTIYVGDYSYKNYKNDRILYKTIKSLELLLPNYTHFFRTNLNTFFNLKNLHNYVENHHQSMFTTPLWQGEWYAVGYSILFTKDVASHICKEYKRLESEGVELISHKHADDVAITALATGIWPFKNQHPFQCCASLKMGTRQLMCKNSLNSRFSAQYGMLLTPLTSLEEAIFHCERSSPNIIIYRTRDGLNLKQIAKFYDYIFHKTYPELPAFSFEKYAKSLRN